MCRMGLPASTRIFKNPQPEVWLEKGTTSLQKTGKEQIHYFMVIHVNIVLRKRHFFPR